MDNNSSISEAPPPVDNVENTIVKLKDDLKGENVVDVTNGKCNGMNDNVQNGIIKDSTVNTTSAIDEANITHESSSNAKNSKETVVTSQNGGLTLNNKNNENGVPAISKQNIQNDNENSSAVSDKRTENCDMVDEGPETKKQLNETESKTTENDPEDLKEPAEEMNLNSDTDEESTEFSSTDSSSDEEDDELDADEMPVRVRSKRGSSGVSATNNSDPLPIDDVTKDNESGDKGDPGESVQKRKRIRRKNLELLNLGIESGPKSKGSSGEEGQGEQPQQKLRRRSHRISDDSSIGDEEVKVVKEKRERRSIHDFGFICDDEDDPPKRKKQRRSIKNPNDPNTNKSPRKPRNGTKDEDRSSTLEELKYAKNLYRPKVSYHELKRTREVFIQYKKCIDFNTKAKKIKVPVCLDCKQQLSGVTKITIEKCRFYGFRKLKVTPKCTLSCGFSDPYTDPADEDKDLWRPLQKLSVTQEDINTAQFIVSFVGDQFCDLAQGEMSTLSLKDEDDPVVWKRTVKSLREMCDVCSTTLFHYQWICEKCGFVACKDCYHSRLIKEIKPHRHGDAEYDEYMWRKCSANKFNRFSSHSLEELLLAQVIVGDTLTDLYKLVHKVRHDWNIEQSCGCPEALKYATEPPPTVAVSTPVAENKKVDDEDSNSGDSSDDEVVDPDLMALFGSSSSSEKPDAEPPTSTTIAKVSEVVPVEKKEVAPQPGKFRRPPTLPRYHIVTKEKYPTVQHSWLCDGKLLRLMEPTNPDNWQIFQEVWKCGQPVLISHVDKKLDRSLWTPQSFSNDFGRMKGVFINCMTGKLVMNQLMKVFWDGFEVVPNRLEDEQGNAMLLKLKDWPEKADFADVLPSRFKDLMKALPLQDYTSREGRFNLASYLPDKFVKPDLGPKMYVAYGSGMHLERGTTNLHLDISDAANVMVYVGEPSDTPENTQAHRESVVQAIKDSDCDEGTIRRILEGKDIPGALWHIYEARDADKIRNFLNENKVKQGIRPDERADPIHDQSCYLDKQLRKDLIERYDIRGYAIIQCAGDAIFIPAGAPHQVRNLQNCIKVAEDFVSPENVHHCFKLTEEFRKLSESHSNHEDKLQIKNIVYHSIKNSVAVLLNEGKFNDNANTPQTNMDVEVITSAASTTTVGVEDDTNTVSTTTPQKTMDVDLEDNNSTASTIPESS